MIDDWKFNVVNDLPEVAAHIDILDNCGNLHRTYFDPKKDNGLPSSIIAWKYVWNDLTQENMTLDMLTNLKQRAKDFYDFTKRRCEIKKDSSIKSKFGIEFQEGKCYETIYCMLGKIDCWVYFKYSNSDVKGVLKNGKEYLEIKNALIIKGVKDSDKISSYQLKTKHFIDSDTATITREIPDDKMKVIIDNFKTELGKVKGVLDEIT